MKKVFFYFISTFLAVFVMAQPSKQGTDTSWKKIYRESGSKVNDLVHTKLDVKPDFSKSYLYGKAWITLKPHFYPTDTLTLDAKGMQINKIAVVRNNTQLPLKYEYDDWQLHINLDKKYKANENYTIYIDYIAKPDEFEQKYNYDQVLGIKGMYFINPRGEEKDKPTQIWTQGETESNSAWFPTIDKTNQKTTEELSVTIDDKYVSLSNGKLVSQKKNGGGTRTDTWKMDLPHSPYLFFLGVGEYAIIKDKYKDKEVSYYVEKEFAPVARKIFGNTPEMIAFYSKITGVEYPWVKYSQITGRDYVAGAMENTTATLHQDAAQQDARQLIDGNGWESVIAHELFHQWFGDYVTAESWSNLTLNESFADYSQTLWEEYKYGKDAGDAENFSGMQGYLQSNSAGKDLVRFSYADREDMFDAVSYQKGGRILNMLRNYVGDSAFFKALNLYLTTNKFKSAEAHQLRLAFEEVTGKDLNWFFNQWYFGNGHPKLDITYNYNEATKQVQVIVTQTQTTNKLFKLPVAIDIYTNGGSKIRKQVWIQNKVDTFLFSSATKPDLINFDGDKVLLAEKKENKTLKEYIYQYRYAGNYVDRREAIDAASKKQNDAEAQDLLITALKDKYPGLRSFTLNKLDLKNEKIKSSAKPIILELAKNEKKTTVRADAIRLLGTYSNPEYTSLFRSAVNDSSYSVSGQALEALAKIDSTTALMLAKELYPKPAKGVLSAAIINIIVKSGDESMADVIIDKFAKLPLGNTKFQTLEPLGNYLQLLKNPEKFNKGIDEIIKFRNAVPEAFKNQTDPFINNIILKQIITSKEKQFKESNNPSFQEQADYVKSKLPRDEKKGF